MVKLFLFYTKQKDQSVLIVDQQFMIVGFNTHLMLKRIHKEETLERAPLATHKNKTKICKTQNLTSFLHKDKEIIKKLLPLWVII